MFKATEDKYRISDTHRIKFVPKCGKKLVNILRQKDPFIEYCEEECFPCESAKEQGIPTRCHKNNIVYEAKCITCDLEGKSRMYHGESSRNLFIRSKEHYSALRSQKESSWMMKHIKLEHDNCDVNNVKFSWKVLRSFTKPLERQITEAVHISEKDPLEILIPSLSSMVHLKKE